MGNVWATEVRFERSFYRDLKRVRDKRALQALERLIEEAKEVSSLMEIRNLAKLQGYENFYRVRIGEWRVGLALVEGEVVFVRFLHRRDIYRYFP